METLIEIPALETIGKSNWLKTKIYNKAQLKEIEDLIENNIWVTADRKKIAVHNMSTNHINNCIKCWNGKGKKTIPSYYLGGKDKWLKIFQSELIKRQ